MLPVAVLPVVAANFAVADGPVGGVAQAVSRAASASGARVLQVNMENSFGLKSGRQQLPQHKRQDTAVLVIVHLDRGVDA